MRPIIGVNGDCLWLCGDVCHSTLHPCLPLRPREPWEAQEEAHRDRSRAEGQIFVFVCHLERKPAVHGAYPYGMGQWDPGTNGWSALTLNTERSKRSSVTHAASRCS